MRDRAALDGIVFEDLADGTSSWFQGSGKLPNVKEPPKEHAVEMMVIEQWIIWH